LKDARRRIEAELDEQLDPERLKQIIDVALSTEKNAWGDFACKSCGKRQRQMVKVPDSVSVAKVLEVLLNQSMGRPTEASEDDHVTVNISYVLDHSEGSFIDHRDGSYTLPDGTVVREVMADKTIGREG
jgi:hypothetical protein